MVMPTGAMSVMLAADDFVGSAADAAVRLMVADGGICDGGVYVIGAPEALNVAERVPQVLPLQPEPERVQETPLFCASLATVAVNVWL